MSRKPPAQFITWTEALEYEIKGSRLMLVYNRLHWKWARNWINKHLIDRATRRYNQYCAMKSQLPPQMPK